MAGVIRDYTHTSFKYIVIGDVGVGKSCYLFQFTDHMFMEGSAQTICVEFSSRIVQVDDKRCKLQVWDTSGQERFRDIAKTYYRGAACIFLMYDITRRSTFDHIKGWLADARETAPSTLLVLIGNKAEEGLLAEVSTEEGQALAQKEGMLFFEVSAKSGHNVQHSIIESTKQVLEKMKNEGMEVSSQTQTTDSITTDSLLNNPNNQLNVDQNRSGMDSIEWAYATLTTYSLLCVSTQQHHQPRMTVRLCLFPWQILGRIFVFLFYMFLEVAFILPCLFLLLVQRPKQIPPKSPSLSYSSEADPTDDKEPVSFPLFVVKSVIALIFVLFYPAIGTYYLIPMFLVTGIVGVQFLVLVILTVFGLIRRLQKKKNPLIIARSEELKMEKHLHKFRWSVVGNYIVIVMIILEWFQFVGFPLRVIGGEKFFNFFYMHFPNNSGTMTIYWLTITTIFVLLAVVNIQMMADMRRYLVLRRQGKLEEASSSFYFSLVGSVIYGHGNPDNISKTTRYFTMVICDGLYFLILFQLYSIFSCTYGSNSGHIFPRLIENTNIICWDIGHYRAAFFGMFFVGYYTLFSNLVSPIIVESHGVSEAILYKHTLFCFIDIFGNDFDGNKYMHFHGMYTTSVNLIKMVVLYYTILVLPTLYPTLPSTPPSPTHLIAGGLLFIAIVVWTQKSSTHMRQPSQSPGANVTRAFTFGCVGIVGAISFASSMGSRGAGVGAVVASICVLFVLCVVGYVLYRRKSSNYGEFTKMTNSSILVEEGSEMSDM